MLIMYGMARPQKCRWVCGEPNARYFKPRGIPLTMLAQSTLTLDELEALRLGDMEGLEQEKAAERMKISRQTFGRILEKARRIVADAIVNGKAIKIEGGDVKVSSKRKFSCYKNSHNIRKDDL
jgi:uncharacterized protein